MLVILYMNSNVYTENLILFAISFGYNIIYIAFVDDSMKDIL